MKDSYAYDFKKGEFILSSSGDVKTVSGISALKIWIDKVLRTQYNRYKIYNGTNYGSNIEDLTIGYVLPIGFTESELKREITKTLLTNKDITAVTSIEITHEKKTLRINISISTIYGAAEEVLRI